MIDTIKFTTAARLLPQYSAPDRLPPYWHTMACGHFTEDRSSQAMNLICDPIGLRVYGRGSCFTSVEVSLPRIQFGHNGRLIKTPEEFNNALAWLNYILRTILVPSVPNDGFIPGFTARTSASHFTRIDLVWQFPASAGVLAALRYAKHGKIRSDPSIFKGQGVGLKGSFLEISAYDKVREMRLMKVIPNAVHRVEIRLRGKALNDSYRYHNGCGYTHITFDWCRQMMRKIASETHAPLSTARGSACIHQFIADMEAEFPHIDILERYIASQGLARESARKFCKRVATLRRPPQGTRVFAKLFPPDAWPPPVEVEQPEAEQQHYAWLREYERVSKDIAGGAAQ